MTTKMKYSKLRSSAEGDHDGKILPEAKENSKWKTIWRMINAVMTVFFSLSAYVQLNDPDPYIWIPIYAVPAVLSVSTSIHPAVTSNSIWRTVCVIHIALCIAGALYLSVIIVEILSGNIGNPLQHEEGRELGGVLIIIAWLCVCRFSSFSSSDASHGTTNALLLMTGVLGCLPLVFWALCFVESLHGKLGHCNDMFPGMLGG